MGIPLPREISSGRHHDIHEEVADAAVALHIRMDVDEYAIRRVAAFSKSATGKTDV